MTTTVPLSALRVMPPRGAPLLWGEAPRMLVSIGDDVGDTAFAFVASDHACQRVRVSDLRLDLTTPTDDRIDGATVAATMLAQAAGLDVSRGVRWCPIRATNTTVRVEVSAMDATGFPVSLHLPAWPAAGAPCDATEPRAILAAVMVAVLGVDRG